VVADYAGAGLKEARLAELFATWTRIAEATHTEFGLIHCLIKNEHSQAYNYGFGVNYRDVRDCGFLKFHARTWLGADLTSFIGRKRLLDLPHTRETSWGGVQLDLVPEPWLADFDTLYRRQQEVMAIFDSWGLLGNYTNVSQTLPGPKWTPRTWGLG
jgi:hypothetical protein